MYCLCSFPLSVCVSSPGPTPLSLSLSLSLTLSHSGPWHMLHDSHQDFVDQQAAFSHRTARAGEPALSMCCLCYFPLSICLVLPWAPPLCLSSSLSGLWHTLHDSAPREFVHQQAAGPVGL